MPDFQIHKGDQWPRWGWDRLRYNLPPVTTSEQQAWRCRVDWGDCPDGTWIKLCGFIDITVFHTKREHWSHFAHGYSDRFLAGKRGDRTAIRAYGYRDGEGGVTESSEWITPLRALPNGQGFDVALDLTGGEARYSVNGATDVVFERPEVSWVRSYALCHADSIHANAPNGEAPADIDVSLERL